MSLGGYAMTAEMLRTLTKISDTDAFWTSDIAYRTKVSTTVARHILKKLESNGLIERVVPGGKGHPTSWRRTEKGAAWVNSTSPLQ